jgi:hypothetical protein
MAEPLIKHIEEMPHDKFMDVYYSNTVGDIHYIYLPTEKRARLERIEEGMGFR